MDLVALASHAEPLSCVAVRETSKIGGKTPMSGLVETQLCINLR